MKKRFSIEKAKWTENREEFYRKESLKIAFNYRHELVIENNIVYVLKGTEKFAILKPAKEKSFWFDTWTELKNYYAEK